MNPSLSSSLVPLFDEHYRCKRPKNDVFVNYSVEDTGNHFVGHFKSALKRNFFTISDHNTLPIGEDESSELLKAIEDSQICVLVFSTKYPISMKSLDELVLIMDSLSKFKNRKVFPLFMNVDPSDVRNLRGCFEEAFRTHEANVDPERVHKWKKALKAAGGRSGLHLKNGDEADFIEAIVKELKQIKIPEKLFYVEHPVGIEPRAQAIISKLRLGDQEFSNIVVVLGIGGSGKSTIVKAVYDRIVADFDCNGFIENIHFYNNKGRNWKVKLQRKVLHRLTGNDPSCHDGAPDIIKVINTRKALLVLDDVENYEELESLGIPFASLDFGSRIIITTRNKLSLRHLPYTPYEISSLNYEEAFELFVGFTYGKDEPNDVNFVKEVVYHAGGLPLVLEIWGRDFKARDRKMWPNLLKRLKRIPHEDIQKKLQMSYDSLCERSKSLFLDIACFFDGMLTSEIFKVLEDQKSTFFPEIELQVLVDRGLVKIEDGKVVLHEVIREMGKEVVRQENEDEPGQRTRLIDRLDVLHVLENNSGTDSVKSIRFDAPWFEKQSIQVDALKEMNNLRFIKLHDDYEKYKEYEEYEENDCPFSFSNDDMLSFKHLKYLEWEYFPQRRINIDMSNVVVIKLTSSKLETLAEGFKNLKKLRVLDVSYSQSLRGTGNFVGLENLEELDLSGCCNLKEVDSSIVCLEKLRLLFFSHCYNIYSIPNLPPNIEFFFGNNCESLACLRSNMYELQSLTFLSLNGCKNIYSIPNLPPNIEKIYGNNCESLACLPSNMYELQSLSSLMLDGCVALGSENFGKLTGLRNLRVLSMRNCNASQVSTEIGNLVSLQKLNLSRNRFSTLPDSFSNLSQLVELKINGCPELAYLPLLPANLEKIEANWCWSLEVMPFDSRPMANIFRSKMFKESLFTRNLCITLSGEIPDWCNTTNKEIGNVFSFVAPMHLDKKICGAILLLGKTTYNHEARMLNKTKETGHRLDISATYQSASFIFYPLIDATLMVEAGDSLEIQFENGGPLSCGLTFIYEGDVIDSALVIQNRNLTHEHTFRVPSEMNATASITQLTDHVSFSSFSILDNGCVYYDFFS